jgi:predicted MFS family arabinose efflux permease
MTEEPLAMGKPSPKIIFVVALLVAVFAAAIIDVVLPINMMDIAATFSILPGTVAQLNSLIAIASVATALLLGGFGPRFRYKSWLLVGTMLIAFCALGLFLAPTFSIAQLIVPLNGIGSVMIVVTAQTFIGNSYPLDKKAKAIGWVSAAGTLANAVGAPIIGFMTGLGGWRFSLIWFMFPTALFSVIFVLLAFPYNPPQINLNVKKEAFVRGFKQVLSNKSAVACLLGTFFGTASLFGSVVFEVTFLRQMFLASPAFAALIGTLAGTSLIAVGAVVGGHIVNRVGRKRLTVIASFWASLFALIAYFMRDLSVFIALRWIGAILLGVTVAAASNLILEQVPQFRGTAMSLSSAVAGVGTAVGITVVGAVLNLYGDPAIGFQALGLTVAAFGFAGALVTVLFAKDPFKNATLKSKSA